MCIVSPPLKMSYPPSYKLASFKNNLHATILTDDKVMMTHGLGAGQIIKLADWLILANDKNVVMFSNDQNPIQEQDYPISYSNPAQEPVQELVKNLSVVGSKFYWNLNDNNYRVAIMTSKGVLQVKSVSEGITDKDSLGNIKKMMFPSEADWRASLPQVDVATKLISADNRTEVQKRIEEPLSDGDDIGKICQFMSRFNIHNDVGTITSPNGMVEHAIDHINSFRAELKRITFDEDINTKVRHDSNRKLNWALRYYNHHKNLASKSQNPDVGTTFLYIRRTNRLRTTIAGVEYEVGIRNSRILPTQIAIRPVLSKEGSVSLYNNLTEMGNPKLYMIYRKRRHELPL